MSLKSTLMPPIAAHLLSRKRVLARRAKAERIRQRSGEPHTVSYFHDASDPYSHLLLQLLQSLLQRYDIKLNPYLVNPAPNWAAPERERLESYSREDATRLAQKAGLNFTNPGHQPNPEHIRAAEAAFASCIADGTFFTQALVISDALWHGGTIPDALSPHSDISAQNMKTIGDAQRAQHGHYLGATLYYGGEWYWGIDRLYYLEERLSALGLALQTHPPLYAQPRIPDPNTQARHPTPENTLYYYLSFRSPYTAIVTERVRALAAAYRAHIELRYVLPMVMRNLPVPKMKRQYIIADAAREAHRLSIPFGRICDPVGKPVERGYALMAWAVSQGRGLEYVSAFLSCVWSEGINAGTDRGLKTIVTRAGLNWEQASLLMGSQDWRAEAEANRREMMELGIWGVPSFRVGNVTAWGQDRLWVIEDELKRLTT